MALTLELTGDDLVRFTQQALGDTPLSADSLLILMQSVLAPWGTDETRVWSARAKGGAEFATGPDPLTAMQRALVLKVFGLTVDLPAAPDDCEDLF